MDRETGAVTVYTQGVGRDLGAGALDLPLDP